MNVTSFDNVTEDDGLDLVHGELQRLAAADLADPARDVLVAIIPEYADTATGTGRLVRLDVVTMAANDQSVADGLGELRAAAAHITRDQQQRRAGADVAENEPTVVRLPPEH